MGSSSPVSPPSSPSPDSFSEALSPVLEVSSASELSPLEGFSTVVSVPSSVEPLSEASSLDDESSVVPASLPVTLSSAYTDTAVELFAMNAPTGSANSITDKISDAIILTDNFLCIFVCNSFFSFYRFRNYSLKNLKVLTISFFHLIHDVPGNICPAIYYGKKHSLNLNLSV